MFLLRAACLFLCSIASFSIVASPWVDVGSDRIRFNIELLNDAGVTQIPTTSWPVMWSDIKLGLDSIETSDYFGLSANLRSAVSELKFEMQYQTRQGVKRSLALSASNGRALFRDFSSQAIERYSFQNNLDWDSSRFAVRLTGNVTSDPDEDDTYESKLDGSHALAVAGNWVFGFGAVDRWWGPGQQSSLILSNNARPIPALQFRTKSTQNFEWPWLSWLGGWQFDSFLGQLESNRVVPEAKLMGMRFVFNPLEGLEIGLSRAAQFGGDGRSESAGTFLDALTTVGENSEDGAGNQLAGFDVRYGYLWFGEVPASVYMQSIGEDEAGFLPSRRIYQFGLKSLLLVSSKGSSLSGYFEYSNTTSDGLFGSEFFNTAYEHSVYQSGYRFRGRSIASTFDNDADIMTAGLNYYKNNGEHYGLVLSYADLNRDGGIRGNSVSTANDQVVFASVVHQRHLFDGKFSIKLERLSKKINSPRPELDQTRIEMAWEYRY